MTDVSDYDKFDYDYSQYWNSRMYEDMAEKHLLHKLFSNKKGEVFLDIGGSYGRLTSTYYDKYSNPIILDYSLKTLIRNKDILLERYPNLTLIAANAYKMPFKDNTFDGALMVRVLHHIEKPQKYIKELHRVMKNNSSYIQEYANKKHIKAIVKGLIKLDFSVFNIEPYNQPQLQSKEGSEKGVKHIFYNYHPKYISNLLLSQNFHIMKKVGCSFLRSPFLKKILGLNLMLSLEKILQKTLFFGDFSPSIFLDCALTKGEKSIAKGKFRFIGNRYITTLLVCPSCKGSLTPLRENVGIAHCLKCHKTYKKREGVWDFRVT